MQRDKMEGVWCREKAKLCGRGNRAPTGNSVGDSAWCPRGMLSPFVQGCDRTTKRAWRRTEIVDDQRLSWCPLAAAEIPVPSGHSTLDGWMSADRAHISRFLVDAVHTSYNPQPP